MKCQAIDCNNKAEYYDEYSGHCGNTTRVKVALCREHIFAGWFFPNRTKEVEDDSLKDYEEVF